jgi:hypothetical protein
MNALVESELVCISVTSRLPQADGISQAQNQPYKSVVQSLLIYVLMSLANDIRAHSMRLTAGAQGVG